MGRMTVTVDDDLLRETQELLGTRTKRETILVALEEARRWQKLRKLQALRGQAELDLTSEELRRLRRRG